MTQASARSLPEPSGAAIKGATVEIHNPVCEYNPTTQTDDQGNFQFTNIPSNKYHLTASASGFQTIAQDVDVRSPVPLDLRISLKIGTSTTTVNVESGADLVKTEPSTHTDIDRGLFQKLPLDSQSSSLSSLVNLASPGVATDSNGLFHGLGDHASNSFSTMASRLPTSTARSSQISFLWMPSIYGGDRGRATSRIWRQRQPRHCGEHAFRSRRQPAAW